MTWTEPDDMITPGQVRLARLEALLAARLEALPVLRRKLETAMEMRYTPSRRTTDPDDPGIRSQGGPVSDVTFDAVVDSPRLDVASTCRKADRMMVEALALLMGAETQLTRAIRRWEFPEHRE